MNMGKETVAATVWNSRIAPVFEVAGQVLVLETENRRIVSERFENLPKGSALEKLDFLSSHGVKTLICGAICRETHDSALNAGIRVIPFAAGDAEEIISAWKSGLLDAARFAMPGCAGRGLRARSGQGGMGMGQCRRGRREGDSGASI